MDVQIKPDAQIVVLALKENGNYPNNEVLPALIYKQIFKFSESDPAKEIEDKFRKNNWTGSWRNGIYSYHHYHSTAHEALGVYAGWAEVQLGGPGNGPLRLEKGDLVILPAGTAHKKISAGDGFAVVGAYPEGQDYDMKYGKKEELQQAKINISKVNVPDHDPVFGKNEGICIFWNADDE